MPYHYGSCTLMYEIRQYSHTYKFYLILQIFTSFKDTKWSKKETDVIKCLCRAVAI